MQGDQIKGPVDSTGMILFDNYTSGKWSSNFASKGGLKTGYMYMVKTSKADSVKLEGSRIKSPAYLPLNTGWNWLGYTRLTAMTVNDAFAFYGPAEGDLIKSKYAFAMYNVATGWIGSLDYLKPGEGYMFKTNKAGRLTYPESGLYKNASASNGSQEIAGWSVNHGQYATNMSLIAKVVLPNSTIANDNWILGAFAGNDCRGTASPELNPLTGNYTYYLTIEGNGSPETIRFRVANSSMGESMNIRETLSYVPDQVSGTLSQPIILNGEEDKDASLLTGELSCKAMPNPFGDILKIDVRSPFQGRLDVQVSNTLGVVLDSKQFDVNKGQNAIEWNNSYVSGIYYVKITINGQSKVLMVVKE